MERIFPAFEKENISIVFAADDNYVPCTAVMLYSILVNGSKSNNYDILFLHSGISSGNANQLQKMARRFENCSLRFVDVTEQVNGYHFYTEAGPDKERLTKETYYRLLLPELLTEYSRVLYLDGDMIALTDVAELYHTELGESYIAACRDLGGLMYYYGGDQRLKRNQEETLKLERPNDYFNAGMLLFNLSALRQAHSTQKLLSVATERNWMYHDQDVLNVLCEHRKVLLPAVWNAVCPETLVKLPAGLQEEFEISQAAPKIVHFAGNRKPWQDFGVPHCEDFWRYAAQTPFIQEIVCQRLYSDRMPGDMMVREFRRGRIGAKYLLKSARAWLEFKLHGEPGEMR